jgi:DNA-binding IclR family transcriptional regulator
MTTDERNLRIPADEDGLSFMELGALCFILNQPDDFEVTPEVLAERGGIRANRARRIIDVLTDAGWLETDGE